MAPKMYSAHTRSVPVALESQVAKELDRLEFMGTITPIQGGVANASPVVWIKKLPVH